MLAPSEAIEVGFDVADYSTFTSDIDLVADGPHRGPARTLIVTSAGAGSLVIVTRAGVERTLTVADGDQIICGVKTIKAATDITRCRVTW